VEDSIDAEKLVRERALGEAETIRGRYEKRRAMETERLNKWENALR